jgi:membrane protease subunit HflC
VKRALVLRFGEVRRAIQEPGLHVKLPIVDDVVYFERRVLKVDPPRQQVILLDQKRLDIDAYGRFRITDPVRFYQAVRTEETARDRLSAVIESSLRRALGRSTLRDVLSERRTEIIQNIRSAVTDAAQRLGVAITAVRIGRADFPEAIEKNTYERMRSERLREAKEFRALGQEQAQKIRADADKQRTIILSEANETAQTLRGKGDAAATRVYAKSFGQDPEFFRFYRSMQAYRKALADSSTTMVISPDNNEFFKYFDSIEGEQSPPTASPSGAVVSTSPGQT